MSASRRFLQVVAVICTLVVGAAAMGVIVTQTAWFKEWLRGFIVRQAEDYVNGRLAIGRLDGNLFFGVELEDVEVTMNGKTVVDIADVGLDYSVFTFLSGHVVLDDIRLNRPVLRIEQTEEGWNVARLIRARTPDPDEPRTRRPIEIGEIGISDGTLFVEAVGTTGVEIPSRIARLDASLGVVSNEAELRIDIAHVSLRAEEPSLDLNALSGVIRRTDDAVTLEDVSVRTAETSLRVDGTIRNIEGGTQHLDSTATSDTFAVGEIARLVPALRGYELQPAFEVRANGPLDAMAVDLDVRDATLGQITGDLKVDAAGPPRRVAGTVSMEHLNVAPLVRRAESAEPFTSDITGQAEIDLALPSEGNEMQGTYSVNASLVQVAGYEARDVRATGRIDGPRIQVDGAAAAYGGRATARGTVVTGDSLQLDLAGRAADVDLRNLPPVLDAPGAPSDLQFSYTLTGRGSTFSGELRFEASQLAGASIAPGTVATFTVGGGAPAYAARGTVADLDLEQIGMAFGIEALAAERFASRVNADFDLEGNGGGRYPLTLDAAGTLVNSELFGASIPQLDVAARFGAGDAHVQAAGRFSGLDPGVVTGNPSVAGSVTGAVDVETTLRNYADGVSAESLDASGRVVLDRSTVAGFTIDTATLEGTYADRSGEIAQLSVEGPDLMGTAKGTLALNDAGASNLTAHMESPSLERIGEIVGRPLEGAVVVDATVTGNGKRLAATGTVQGSNVGYGEHGALSLKTAFEATLPELTPAEMSVQAKGAATFLEVGGQSINELTFDATYSQETLEFDALAKEGARELNAGGTAVLHTDHQEVHLTNLALRAEQIEWRIAPGTDARIQYGDDRIAIADLQLVNGPQRIAADGVLGSEGEALQVRAENVDVSQLDRLLLGQERLAGRLSATATITGALDQPRAEGQLTLTEGVFRDATFESLTADVDYAGRGLNVDVRLQQSPQAWLTATGYAPLSLFRPTPPEAAGSQPGPEEMVDLRIETSQIDLGLIQGFTSYVTDVTGVLQANMTVTGTGFDPRFDGAVDIRGGTFAIPDLGTAYTGLDTRIELEPETVTISEMRIVDEHSQVMTIGGTLAVREREVGAVDVRVQSENFEVIDNELADLKLDTNVTIGGDVRAPRVRGFVEVETGTVDVARVLDLVTSDAYATEAVAIDPLEPASAGPPPALPQPGLMESVDLEVGVGIPSNLVLRGSDLRPANAPIDIGDLVVTVGGALQIRKAPGDAPRLLGEVNTVRGNYTFQGRRFELLRDGRIRFAGTDVIDPLLDIRARRVISGVETFIRVQGTMRQPELTFSSTPPLDQADVLSLIIFNLPINELGEGQQVSLAERAGALAGGYLVSGLTESIASALDLDEFEFTTQGEFGAGPSLSIGEQVGERLFFRIRQGFGDEQATEFILEYQLAEFLRLQGQVTEVTGGRQRVTFRRVERGGLDLIFFFSY